MFYNCDQLYSAITVINLFVKPSYNYWVCHIKNSFSKSIWYDFFHIRYIIFSFYLHSHYRRLIERSMNDFCGRKPFLNLTPRRSHAKSISTAVSFFSSFYCYRFLYDFDSSSGLFSGTLNIHGAFRINDVSASDGFKARTVCVQFSIFVLANFIVFTFVWFFFSSRWLNSKVWWAFSVCKQTDQSILTGLEQTLPLLESSR